LDKPNSSGFSLIGEQCNKETCLFNSDYNTLGGFGKIKGYYSQEQKSAWGETKTCDVFIVTEGNQNLIQHFKEEVKKRKLNKSSR